ncbi:hypothetical protein [Formosa sp. A9]|uniref:hypothetical protein n=1 Tax=Formosa sp. A9 TaxID=3442641 RepID=UPI003EBAA07A
MLSIREQYHLVQTENQLELFLDTLDAVECDDKTPYLASAIMRKAEFTSWPLKKISYFKEGKNMLEDFILKHPKHLEARYVRVLTQHSIPKFLGYSSNIDEDLQFINTHLETAELPENYKLQISETIKQITTH